MKSIIRMNEKIIIFFFVSLCFGLAGCGADNEATNDSIEEPSSEYNTEVAMEIVSESVEKLPDKDASLSENVSVSSDSFETNSGVPGENEYQLYYDLIDKINAGIENNFSDYSTEDLDVTSCFNYTNASYEIIGYLIEDIDGDGVDELLIGANSPDPDEEANQEDVWDNIIYDMFTIKNGEMAHVLAGWERKRYYLCTNGNIAKEASGGAAHSIWGYYKYDDQDISLIECVFTDGGRGEDIFYFTTNSDESESEDAVGISEQEAKDIMSKYKYATLTFTPFKQKMP